MFVQFFESLGSFSEVTLCKGKNVLRHSWVEGLDFTVSIILNDVIPSEEQLKHRQNDKPCYSVFGFLIAKSSLVCWYLYNANNFHMSGSLLSKYVVVSTEEID